MKKTKLEWRTLARAVVMTIGLGLAIGFGQTGKTVQAAQQPTGYVTVVKRNYKIWNNLKWQHSVSSNSYVTKTLGIQGKPVRVNRMWYYALQRADGSLVGYINQYGVKQASGAQGAGFGTNRYVTIWKPNVNIYGGFSWNKLSTTNAVYQKTLHARVLYHHFNGMDYYSLYDKANHWAGYLNTNAVRQGSSSMGRLIAQNRYVTVTSKDYYVYRDVSYHHSSWSSSMYYGAFHVTGQYNALNGATYLALSDSYGHAKGLLNASATRSASGAQGIAIPSNEDMTVSDPHAVVWRNFAWSEQAPASSYQGKTLKAKVHYNHFNGATYYSLYDGNTWVGYANGGFLSYGSVRSSAGAPFHKTGYAALGVTFKVTTYNAPNGQKTGTTLRDGQKVTITRARLIGNTMWYQIGSNLWATDKYISLSRSYSDRTYTTAYVRNKVRANSNRSSATVYDRPGGRAISKISASTIATFSNREVYKGQMWYQIGSGRWVSGSQVFEILPYQTPHNLFQVSYTQIKPVGTVGYNLGYDYEGVKTWLVLGKLGLSRSYANMSRSAVAALKSFQRRHGLPATGVVNLTTWKKLGLSESLWTSLDRYIQPLGAQWYNSRSEHIEAMIKAAYKYLGRPYIVGASSSPYYGVDCSGLVTQALYAAGISPLPVSSIQHAHPGNEWNCRLLAATNKFQQVAYSKRQRGDLIFYTSPYDHRVWHVAIYLGGNKVIESWPSHVMVSSIKNSQRSWVTKVVRPFT